MNTLTDQIYDTFNPDEDLQPCAKIPQNFIEQMDFSECTPHEYRTDICSGGITLVDETDALLGSGDTMEEAFCDALYYQKEENWNWNIKTVRQNFIDKLNKEKFQFLIYNEKYKW